MNYLTVCAKASLNFGVNILSVVNIQDDSRDTKPITRDMVYVDDPYTIDITFKFTFPADVLVEEASKEAVYYTQMFLDISYKRSTLDADTVMSIVKNKFINGTL